MGRSFLPTTDDGLLSFALNFSTLVSLNYLAYGVTQSVANTCSSKYNTYKTTLAAAQQPPTRGNATILAKDNAKKDLIGYIRQVARTIGNNMAVTDAQRQQLGLTIRKHPSPVPAPSVRPGMDVTGVVGRTIALAIHDSASSAKRAKPAGAAQALVYYFVGDNYPSDPNGWSFAGPSTKAKYSFNVPDSTPGGATVWLSAAWTNRAGDSGPMSVPISTNVQGGGVATVEGEMKIAA